jgi:hypothetical protein
MGGGHEAGAGPEEAPRSGTERSCYRVKKVHATARSAKIRRAMKALNAR